MANLHCTAVQGVFEAFGTLWPHVAALLCANCVRGTQCGRQHEARGLAGAPPGAAENLPRDLVQDVVDVLLHRTQQVTTLKPVSLFAGRVTDESDFGGEATME